MDDPLNRKMIVALLALLPMLLFALACQTFHPPVSTPQSRQAAELAALPGKASEAPLFTAQMVPGVITAGAMDSARAQNAGDPFFVGKLDPAPPFRFAGSPADLGNARDCLALAAMAEAGNSDQGQRAVIQVILNRVRHPAFAKTVCGVVFEGSQRSTGCQFTFTCDGSLARRYGGDAWEAARQRAAQALKGSVFATVGTATHYHTDWVYPRWSPQLEKIGQVETHLFYRWPGRWGTALSWSRGYGGGEPSFAVLTRSPAALPLDIATTAGGDPGDADAAMAVAPLPLDTPKVKGGVVAMRLPSGKANFVVIRSGASPGAALAIAKALCPGVGSCRVLGWSDRAAVPASYPLPREARASLQFSYARDPAGTEIVLYNCEKFKAVPREQCIPAAR